MCGNEAFITIIVEENGGVCNYSDLIRLYEKIFTVCPGQRTEILNKKSREEVLG